MECVSLMRPAEALRRENSGRDAHSATSLPLQVSRARSRVFLINECMLEKNVLSANVKY